MYTQLTPSKTDTLVHYCGSHRYKTNISVRGIIDIQTAITNSSCGSEIYCACSSIIHKGTQKIWSDFNKAF